MLFKYVELKSLFKSKNLLAASPFISSEKINGDEVLIVESRTNEGQTSESDMKEYYAKAKPDMKQSDSKPEQPPSVEKEGALTKTKSQTGRPRQTQSGPLVPGMVISNSHSERARNFERFILSFLHHLTLVMHVQ